VSKWTEKRHRVAIAGVVVDGVTGKPVAGARVEIKASPKEYQAWLARQCATCITDPARPEVVRTRRDGLFYFLDLPAGDYSLYLFLPRQGMYRQQERLSRLTGEKLYKLLGDKRYGTIEHRAVVAAREPEPDKYFAPIENLRLPPTGFCGRVVSEAGKAALAMAQVRVKGSGESAFTDAEGRYTVTGLEPDKLNRTVEVRARGHHDRVGVAEVHEAGKLFELKDIELPVGRG
jgi:hypothetical protein